MTKKKLGPWTVEPVCRLGEIKSDAGYQIMDGDDVIVEMFESNGWNNTQMKRILRLMAAAPDMLEALQRIAAWDPAKGPDENGGMSIMDAIDIAKAAIKKARGKIK